MISKQAKRKRSVRALLLLQGIVNFLSLMFGLVNLLMGYYFAPQITVPAWQLGQYGLILGGVNFLIFLALAFQLRALDRSSEH